MTAPIIEIRYRRLPDRVDVFRQHVLEDAGDHVVTYLEAADVARPLAAEGITLLEPGAPIVWFTYPGAWFDIGRFHLADGTFTGFYADILTPVRMEGRRWETTDLLLDIWHGVDRTTLILDEEEFATAVALGWIDPPTARTARATADRIASAAQAGTWPPDHVHAWTLERARARMREIR